MVCCVLLATLAVLLVSLFYLMKKRAAKKKEELKQKLLEKFHKFGESEIYEFDPTKKINENDIVELKDRLRKRRINDNLAEPDANPYGTPTAYINKIADYWTEKFDFGSVGEVLGKFRHYKTVIGDLDLHFIHMVGDKEKMSHPILLCNGFPSTVWEFHKSIPLLHKQGYTIIVPSLAGHGFTDPPRVPGVSPAVIACTYHKLMMKLGYSRYVVHGGDWGAAISHMLTYLFPEHVIGLHLTMNTANVFCFRQLLVVLVGCVAPSLVYKTSQEQAQFHPLSKVGDRSYLQWAYFHIQSCQPDTFGYGMVDSPTALIAWHGATYAIATTGMRRALMGGAKPSMAAWDNGIELFGIDNICAQLTIFWCMKNAQAAMRIYYEFWWNDRHFYKGLTHPTIPVAISNFPNEIIHITEFVSRATFSNIVQFTYHDKGGHFAHLDATDLAVSDILKFISKI